MDACPGPRPGWAIRRAALPDQQADLVPPPAGGNPRSPATPPGQAQGKLNRKPNRGPDAAASTRQHAVPRAAARREFSLALAAGAAGAGLVLLALAQPWARAVLVPAAPLPPAHVTVTGRELAPAAGALAIAALACLAAIIATRGLARRAVSTLLAATGAVITADAAASARHAHVAATAAAHSLGAARGAGTEMPAFPWWAAAAAGGLVIVAAGALAVWRAARWPAMSSRYDRPGGSPRAGDDPAAAWDALDRGADPTVRNGGQ